ncbi:MAG: ROK family transcriptional regulator [Oscillibacter sp.]|nr:ROK family transcriptional regulator [Oscillibacter sp.]
MITNAIEIRQWNIERIRNAVQHHETCTKADIARETGLSMATCSTALKEMQENGEIVKVDQIGIGIGRPSDLFAYNRDFLHVLCIAIYEDDHMINIELSVADALGTPIHSKHFIRHDLHVNDIETLVKQHIDDDALIKSVGIGIPGVVVDDVIEFCDIKPLEKVNFAQLFSQQYHVDVTVKNDMNIVTYYLYHKDSNCPGDFAVMYYPDYKATGYVGCGIVVDGRILRGNSMFSGELFHLASAYGISFDEQKNMLLERSSFQKLAALHLMSVICTVNPSNAVIMGNHVTQEDIDAIRQLCLEHISSRHLPALEFSNDIYTHYSNGLIRQTLDSHLFPFMV